MEEMMKRWISFLLTLSLLLGVSACGTAESSKVSETEEEKKIQIGLTFDSFVIERWQRDRDVFVSVAKELGAEVNVQNANGDVEEQKKQIDYFIQKDMDVIVIIAIDPQELRESVAKAKDAGIKVVAYDRLIDDADIDLYISFNNEMVGALMGHALINEGLGGGDYVIMLGGPYTDNNVPLVEGAFKRVMEQNRVTILGIQHAEGWRAEIAAAYVYANGVAIQQTDAIMCGNDDLATQVVRALAESQQAGDILVVGQDADLAACQRIVEGTQLMTVYKPVERLATRAAEASVALGRGESLGEDVTVMESGAYTVPYIGLIPISVTRDNIDEVIIGSGFHLKEDVYLNVPD